MKKNVSVFSVILFVFSLTNIFAQESIEELLKNFSSSDWNIVKEAKEKLENYEGQSIPQLLSMLDNNKVIKLQNTGSLIYPGAEKFFGYGQIVDYDIDNISVRAGWLLEELTFNNFGFSGVHLAEEDVIPFIKITFPDYYNNANNRKNLESSSLTQKSEIIRVLSLKHAKEWWIKESAGWNRLDALVDALQSFDEKRQNKALFYMRNSTSRCTGLTKDYYIDNMSKLIVRLSSSDTKRISENAKLILFDDKFQWIDNKIH